jgi:PhoH-like ATPase
MEKKTYVLDTNVLLSDPNSLYSFEDNDVIIPMVVLEELDKQKSRQDEVGKNARQVSRSLDEIRTNGKGSLVTGVELSSGGTLKVVQLDSKLMESMPFELQNLKNDNLIIATMFQFPEGILVTKDINVRIKCDSLGIICDDYRKQRVTNDAEEFYRGVEVVDVDQDVIDSLHGGPVDPQVLPLKKPACPNQIIILKSGRSSSVITKCVMDATNQKRLEPIQNIESVLGLEPKNKEQRFSLDLLYDPNIKLLTLVGPSGTGKTLLALAAALDQLKDFGKVPRYNKLIVTRPVQPVGKDIGFLPGTLEEKMEPWIAPIRDNLNFLLSSQKKRGTGRKTGQQGNRQTVSRDDPYLQMMQEKGLIEIEAITFIRGRSIPNSIIIIDEAQNLSMHELKTIVTRVGEGTKIVLTGDIEQIDNIHVDAFTNGLTAAVEKFKDYSISGHVTLLKGERSELATLASKIL